MDCANSIFNLYSIAMTKFYKWLIKNHGVEPKQPVNLISDDKVNQASYTFLTESIFLAGGKKPCILFTSILN